MMLDPKTRRNAVATGTLDHYDARRGSRIARRNVVLFAWAAVLAILALLMVMANTKPSRSQAVQLVKLDVAVVAKGFRATKLIGSSVVNEKNEKVGALDDIVIGRDRTLFAVLQVGGFLGLGSRLVAVPYESLKIDDAGKKIELPGASKDELKKLTEFRYPA
jgi:sporulation protein YlmC with PRC-barrel domain